jgi:3-oxoacyl-[acyl-carrier-protein] synthase II
MLLGEGAGILILEELDSALKRKAPIYAEVLGYGYSCDAYNMTIPKKEGVFKAMKKALNNSKIKPDQVSYISAHGTGTGANDKNEVAAIKELFGERYKTIPINSIKSMLGHTMGAASAIEAISCCLSINRGEIPPTINYQTPDPDCDIDCVPNITRKANVDIALNNGFAFGGNNCCVVFGKIKQR